MSTTPAQPDLNDEDSVDPADDTTAWTPEDACLQGRRVRTQDRVMWRYASGLPSQRQHPEITSLNLFGRTDGARA